MLFTWREGRGREAGLRERPCDYPLRKHLVQDLHTCSNTLQYMEHTYMCIHIHTSLSYSYERADWLCKHNLNQFRNTVGCVYSSIPCFISHANALCLYMQFPRIACYVRPTKQPSYAVHVPPDKRKTLSTPFCTNTVAACGAIRSLSS